MASVVKITGNNSSKIVAETKKEYDSKEALISLAEFVKKSKSDQGKDEINQENNKKGNRGNHIMERSLYINNFRNIGIEDSERLVLNHSLEKGKIGNLVIIVGPNNAGKSNVLDAISTFKKGTFTERDKTNISYDPEMQKPNIALVCKDEDVEYSYRVNYDGKVNIFGTDLTNSNIIISEKDIEKIQKELRGLNDAINNYGYTNYVTNRINLNNIREDDVISFMRDFKKNIQTNGNMLGAWRYFCDSYPNSILHSIMDQDLATSKNEQLEELYKNKYGTRFMPNVIIYEEKMIKNNDISTNIDNLSNNKFLCKLFNMLNISLDEVKNAYQASRNQRTRGALTTLEKKINKKLEKISDDFNNLYFADDNKYRFSITLETNNIFFELFRGESDLSLDYQSTGFKWFFNLYFNLLNETELQPGDIIIMDEPATHLHIKGMAELRDFLKEFAVKNDLTIVLATHLPFLIDLNCLDELRVIVSEDNKSRIKNDFATIDIDDPDALKAVRTALTVSNHILLDPDKKVIFVEGITDYNYMLAFKQILGIEEDFIFLPIQGVENVREAGYKERQLERSKRLMEIKKHDPILMVDGDKAGKSMRDINKEDSDLTVFSLIDVDPNFRMIESLFSDEDANKLGLKAGDKYVKSSSKSAVIKNHFNEYDFSNETKSNFKKVFDYIENLQ